MKILVIGSSGMLGQTMCQFLKENGHDVFSTSRDSNHAMKGGHELVFDVTKDEIQKLDLHGMQYDYVVNCVGLIRQQMSGNSDSNLLAAEINTLFPLRLIQALEGTTTKLIQIGTDCVFSGNTGQYSESANQDPVDPYGYSKALGEVFSKNQMILRSSIIGLEKHNFLSLMEWLLSQPKNAQINGFINHSWNGVTTYAFAKLVDGIISNDHFKAGTFHIVPDGLVSKFELLVMIASLFQRKDLNIIPVNSEVTIDRTLSTEKKSENKSFWSLAGYEKIPTHQDMLIEYAAYVNTELNMRGLS
jgi:dTDP-4-dehydrorhamnose reductase